MFWDFAFYLPLPPASVCRSLQAEREEADDCDVCLAPFVLEECLITTKMKTKEGISKCF